MALPYYIYDLLEDGNQVRWGANNPVGTPVTVYFDFPATIQDGLGSQYSGFTPFSETEKTAARNALAYISSLTNITFVEASAGAHSTDVIHFGNVNLSGNSGITNYTYGSSGLVSADVFMSNNASINIAGASFIPGDLSTTGNTESGGFAWQTMLHEIGHSLGLKHPFDRNSANDPNSVLPTAEDNRLNSVMSYTDYSPDYITTVTGNQSSYSYTSAHLQPQTYDIYDIAALQYLYGVNAQTSTGNKTWSFSANSPIYETEYDTGANNTIDCSQLSAPCTISMVAGTSSTLGTAQVFPSWFTPPAGSYNGTRALTLAYGARVDNAIGGSGADTITGNTYNNRIDGGAGNDTINGGGGVDTALYTNYARSQATVTRQSNGTVTVAAPNGTDTLSRIDWLQFSDQKVWSGKTGHDFSNDGNADVLFRNASGITYLWQMNNTTVTNGTTTSVQVGTNWHVTGLGDFDGNGTTDLLWTYNNSSNAGDSLNGISYITFQNGATASASSGVVQQLSTVWTVAGVGDFDNDGKADILWRNSSTGQTYLDLMNGTSVTSASGFTSQQVPDLRWQVAGVGDFNGDGTTDVLWRYNNTANPADSLNGATYLWTMNGTTVTSAGLLSQQAGSANWNVAGIGDFDGNGTDDVLFRYNNSSNASDPLNGFTYVDFLNGSTVTSGAPTQWQVDNSWLLASVADYNGDGHADIMFQQNATGNTYLWDMNGTATVGSGYTSQQAGLGWSVQNGSVLG